MATTNLSYAAVSAPTFKGQFNYVPPPPPIQKVVGFKSPTLNTPNVTVPNLPKPKATPGVTTPASGLLNKAETYGRALLTSPGTTISRIATKQGVQRVDNGAIISARLPYTQSTAIKKQMGGFNAGYPTNLDHTQSLEIGGTNQQKNLRVEPAAQNAYDATHVEDYLGTALKDNLINAKTAQNIENQYKSGKIGVAQVYTAVKATPIQHQSILNRIGGAITNVNKNLNKAGEAVISPISAVATGKGGKAVAKTAQLSQDLTGGTVNQFAKAARFTPQMIAADVSGNAKAQASTQKKAFGTTNPGQILKKAIGSTVGTASLLVGGGEAAEAKQAATQGTRVLAKNVAKDALTGAVGNASIAASQGQSGKNILKSGAQGTVFGGVPLIPKAAGEIAGTVKTLTNNDQGVKDLINSTRQQTLAAKLNDIASKGETQSNLGGVAIKDANTTKIPVIGPTQTAAARSSLGQTAIDNADRTSIPVTGKSTQVVGKVATASDAKYINASNNLSDQYEKDLANVKNNPNPITQQVLQRQLDQKYTGLQQNLDDTYGKTSISFKGKPQTVADSGSVLPKSALDQNPVTPFNSTRIPEPVAEPKVVTSTPTQPKATTTAPTTPTVPKSGDQRVSGSALASESRAVQRGLTSDLGDKTTYTGGSYKQEADKAVQLVNSDPDKAKQIALGNTPGDNTIHEVAVRRAVENKALQAGDVGTLRELAGSSQHAATSEAAQRLGSEGFNSERASPVDAIRNIQETRAKALASRSGVDVDKATESTVKDIQKTAAPKLKVSRQDWHSFIQELQCK